MVVKPKIKIINNYYDLSISNNCNNSNLNDVNKNSDEFYFPKDMEEEWIVKQIKKIYSELKIAHFNILKINAKERKELYKELLLKYKISFKKEFVPINMNNENENAQTNPNLIIPINDSKQILKEVELRKLLVLRLLVFLLHPA